MDRPVTRRASSVLGSDFQAREAGFGTSDSGQPSGYEDWTNGGFVRNGEFDILSEMRVDSLEWEESDSLSSRI